MPVSQPPTEGPQAANVGESLPLSVGVHYDDAFLALRRQATVTGGHRAVLPLGATGAAEFQAACERRFRSCARLSSAVPAQAATGLDLVIEPRFEEANITPPPMLGWAGYWNIRLAWTVDVMTPSGGRVAEARAEGTGSNEGAVDMSISGLGHSAQALSNASRRLAEDFFTRFPSLPGVAARFPGLGAGGVR
jgi:hypothetical protein